MANTLIIWLGYQYNTSTYTIIHQTHTFKIELKSKNKYKYECGIQKLGNAEFCFLLNTHVSILFLLLSILSFLEKIVAFIPTTIY